MQNTAKQNYPGSVASNDTWPGNKVGLFYNAAKPTQVTSNINLSHHTNHFLKLGFTASNALRVYVATDKPNSFKP